MFMHATKWIINFITFSYCYYLRFVFHFWKPCKILNLYNYTALIWFSQPALFELLVYVSIKAHTHTNNKILFIFVSVRVFINDKICAKLL